MDQSINDAPGHGAYVCLAMAADIRLIPHAAQADTVELAVHSLGNRDSNRGLSHARRAYQADNLALGLGMDLADSYVFQYALFHLCQAIMILIQHSPSLFHIGPLLGFLAPGHLQTGIQIIADHRRLGAAVWLLGQARDLLHQLLLNLLVDL